MKSLHIGASPNPSYPQNIYSVGEQFKRDYQEVEYIESTGTQFINTGIVGKNLHTSLESKCTWSSNGGGSGVNSLGGIHYVYDSVIRTGGSWNGYNYTIDEVVTVKAYYDSQNRRIVDINGNTVCTGSEYDSQDGNIHILKLNDGSRQSGKTYWFKIYNDDVLIFNGIPCYRKSDNKPGLYDVINNIFYTNSGTGEFTYGPEVPNLDYLHYQEVEYIESTGTQYIDTGIIPYKTTTELKYAFTNLANEQTVAGCFNEGNNRYYVCQIDSVGNLSFRNKSNTIIFNTTSDTDIHTIKYNDTNNYVFLDNQNIGTVSNLANSLVNSLTLFARKSTNMESYSKSRIYYCKIWEDEVLVRNFIPCYRKSDNEIGLYDTINNVFYTNSGTGTFLKGNDIENKYSGNCNVVIENKNLLNITNVKPYIYSSSLPLNNATDFTISSFSSNSLSFSSQVNGYRFALLDTIKLEPNTTYTISYTRTNSLTQGALARRWLYNWNEIDGYTMLFALNDSDSGNMSYTFTTDSYGYLGIAFGFNNTASGSSSVVSNIQIEKGTTVTSFIPHQEQTYTIPCQQPMRSLGTVRDKFVKVNDNWVERHNIGNTVLNGNEYWERGGTANNYRFRNFTLSGLAKSPINNATKADIMSNYFSVITADGSYSENEGDGVALDASSVVYIYFEEYKQLTAEDFKTWLSTHNTEVNYLLSIPIDLPCTSDQTEILEQICKSISYNEQTNIYSIDKVSPMFNVKAYRNMNSSLNNLEARIELLEGRSC